MAATVPSVSQCETIVMVLAAFAAVALWPPQTDTSVTPRSLMRSEEQTHNLSWDEMKAEDAWLGWGEFDENETDKGYTVEADGSEWEWSMGSMSLQGMPVGLEICMVALACALDTLLRRRPAAAAAAAPPPKSRAAAIGRSRAVYGDWPCAVASPRIDYRAAFECCVKDRDADRAAAALRQLIDFGSHNIDDVNNMINLCSKANDIEGASSWLRSVPQLGLSANCCCYNTVVNAYAKCGKIREAVELTDVMAQAGVPPDTITYNTLIAAFARAEDACQAEEWMEKMFANGVRASVVSFGSLMPVFARAGRGERIHFWLQRADEMGIELNSICFSAVISGFAGRGDVDSAIAWLAHMCERGVATTRHCFVSLVDLALNTEDVMRAVSIVSGMFAATGGRDEELFSWLVIATTRANKFRLACFWASECDAAGCRLNLSAKSSLRHALQSLPEEDHAGAHEELRCVWGACVGARPEQQPPAHQGLELAATPGPATCSGEASTTAPPLADARTANFEGRRFVGTIKQFVSTRFGYLSCEETFALFHRDVFIGNRDNPQGFARGQRVSFRLVLDKRRRLPRAVDLEAHTAGPRAFQSPPPSRSDAAL